VHDEEAGTERALLPVPDAGDISQAAMVNFEELELDLKKIVTSLEGVTKLLVK